MRLHASTIVRQRHTLSLSFLGRHGRRAAGHHGRRSRLTSWLIREGPPVELVIVRMTSAPVVPGPGVRFMKN